MSRNQRLFFLVFSISLYISSLMTPAFYIDENQVLRMGYEVLATGWIGIILLEPRWYANIIYLYVCFSVFKGSRSGSGIAALFSLLLALSSLIIPIHVLNNATREIPVDHLGIGAYVWAIAIFLTSFIYFFLPLKVKSK